MLEAFFVFLDRLNVNRMPSKIEKSTSKVWHIKLFLHLTDLDNDLRPNLYT